MPRIGVSVSTFRRQDNLEKLIRSVLAHTKPDDFVVGIDDENDVASAGICKSLSVEYYKAPNKGVAVNKNRLIKILYDRGCDYIFLLEDDLIIIKECLKPYVSIMEQTGLPLMSGLHPDLVEFPKLDSNFSIIKTIKEEKFDIVYPSSCSNIFMVLHRNIIDLCGYFNTKQYKNKYGRVQTMWLGQAKGRYSALRFNKFIEKKMGWPDIKQGRSTYQYIKVDGGMIEEDKIKEVSAFRESYIKYHAYPLSCVPYQEEKIVLKNKVSVTSANIRADVRDDFLENDLGEK